MSTLSEILVLLIPLFILQIGLLVWALVDLVKRPMDKTLRIVWLLVILLVNTIGPILYLLIGRKKEQ